MEVVLFILLGLTGFALLLALQMRWLISMALRRGLAEKFGGQYTDVRYRQGVADACLLYTSPSPRDLSTSRMPSSA